MNRRQFFGMTAAAVASAGLPALVLPDKTIFLPPRGGWWAPHLRLREVEQYTINDDALWLRYDAAWKTLLGERVQVYCEPFPLSGLDALYLSEEGMLEYRRECAEQARITLAKMKPFAGIQVELPLYNGRYV